MVFPAPSGPPSDAALAGIDAATGRLLATLAGLRDADWRADTVLPEWTRAHVAAHLVLNYEAMTAVLDGLHAAAPTPMYPSDESRDAAIDALAAADPTTISARLRAGVEAFGVAVRRVPHHAWRGSVHRLPGGPSMPTSALVGMRRREIEIHHADLGAGYSPTDWPDEFVVELLDTMAVDHAGSGPFRITATDLARSWQVGGDGGAEVTGTGAALGWWLLGRERRPELRCDAGQLPSIGPWRSRR